MDNNQNKEFLLAQWQTCVEMANSISQRRDTMNNLFVTLNTAILAAVAVVWDFKSLLVMIAGIILCIIWILFIHNFKILNAEKFHVINDIEQKLPEQPFSKEWELLKNNKHYSDGTKLEKILPIMFILLYTIAIIAIIIIKIQNGGTTS
jgi:hypothetical protein